MTRIYIEFILILIVTPNEAIPIHCHTTDEKRLNDLEALNKEVTTKAKLKSRCCPYNFDPTHCKVVGDRLLCGYNRNIGGFKNDNAFMELANGCRLRGGRVECGYVIGPFTNPRRPPAIDNNSMYDNIVSKTTANDVDKNGSKGMEDDKQREPLKHVTLDGVFHSTTRCLEIQERVVCRH